MYFRQISIFFPPFFLHFLPHWLLLNYNLVIEISSRNCMKMIAVIIRLGEGITKWERETETSEKHLSFPFIVMCGKGRRESNSGEQLIGSQVFLLSTWWSKWGAMREWMNYNGFPDSLEWTWMNRIENYSYNNIKSRSYIYEVSWWICHETDLSLSNWESLNWMKVKKSQKDYDMWWMEIKCSFFLSSHLILLCSKWRSPFILFLSTHTRSNYYEII